MSMTQDVPQYPKSEQAWDAQKDTITRLYQDEKWMLKDVIAFMHDKRKFKATENMSKNHIGKWGLDKRNKKGEMLAIVRKKSQRSAIGKQSLFKVRNKKVDLESIFRFMQRKGLSEEEVVAQNAPTPPSLEVYTPPRRPSSHHDIFGDSYTADGHTSHYGITSALPPENANIQHTPAPGVLFRSNHVESSNIYDFQRALTPLQRWTADRTAFETFLFTMKDYIVGYFEAATWVDTGEKRYVQSLRDPDRKGMASLAQISRYLETICNFIESDTSCQIAKKIELLLVRAGTEISAALVSETMHITNWVLQLLGYLKRYNNPRCRYVLRRMFRYFSDMASALFKTHDHPIARMFTYISNESPDTEVAASSECFQMLTDIFEHKLGKFHSGTIGQKLCLYRCLAREDREGGLARLLRLLDEVTETYGTSDIRTLSVMDEVTVQYYAAADYTKAEVCGTELLDAAWVCGSIFWQARALELVANLLYMKYEYDVAVEYLQMAIELLEKRDSMDPRILHDLVTLEKWMVKKGDLHGAARVRHWKDEVFERHMPELL